MTRLSINDLHSMSIECGHDDNLLLSRIQNKKLRINGKARKRHDSDRKSSGIL